jgi:hypothetical protein
VAATDLTSAKNARFRYDRTLQHGENGTDFLWRGGGQFVQNR